MIDINGIREHLFTYVQNYIRTDFPTLRVRFINTEYDEDVEQVTLFVYNHILSIEPNVLTENRDRLEGYLLLQVVSPAGSGTKVSNEIITNISYKFINYTSTLTDQYIIARGQDLNSFTTPKGDFVESLRVNYIVDSCYT